MVRRRRRRRLLFPGLVLLFGGALTALYVPHLGGREGPESGRKPVEEAAPDPDLELAACRAACLHDGSGFGEDPDRLTTRLLRLRKRFARQRRWREVIACRRLEWAADIEQLRRGLPAALRNLLRSAHFHERPWSPDAVLSRFEELVEVCARSGDEREPDMLYALDETVRALRQRNGVLLSWRALERGEAALEAACGPHSPALAEHLALLAEPLTLLGHYDVADEMFRRVVEIHDRGGVETGAALATACYRLGQTCTERVDFERAEEWYWRAWRADQEAGDRRSEKLASDLDAIARLRVLAQRFPDAAALVVRANALRAATRDEFLPVRLEWQAWLHERAGDSEAARAAEAQALQLRRGVAAR